MGIVGAWVDESSYGWGSYIIEYFAVGAAVAELTQNYSVAAPQMVLPLNGWLLVGDDPARVR